jgi:TolB-like protein/Tfp pilus assembly protein PilF
MYEMVTGVPPSSKLEHRKTQSAKPILEVGKSLMGIIYRCLDEDPDSRYQSASDLADDLRELERERSLIQTRPIDAIGRKRSIGRGSLLAISAAAIFLILGGTLYGWFGSSSSDRPIRSVAVLPFLNSSNDSNSEFIGDGMTESLINSLSRLSGLRVVPWSTSFRYKGEADVSRVGRDLKVDAVMTGRIIQLSDKLIIRADLVDPADSRQLWGAQFDENATDLLSVQEQIAMRISERLRTRLTGEEATLLAKRYTDNTRAYELYLRGRFFWNKRNTESYKRAIDYFQQAISMDANYALAYAGLADCYVLGGDTPEQPRNFMPRARAAALKALSLDESLAEAHTSLAKVKHSHDWDFDGAEREFKRALELSPNYATAHQWYGVFLSAMGRHEESIAHRKWAQELDPTSLSINTGLGRAYYWARQYEQAIEQCRETHELEPGYVDTHWSIGLCYEQNGLHEQAIAEFQDAVSLSRSSPVMVAALAHAYAIAGKRAESRNQLEFLRNEARQRYISPYSIGLIYAALEDTDRAFEWFEQAFKDRDEMLTHLNVDPRLDDLRSDPRFKNLVARVGL